MGEVLNDLLTPDSRILDFSPIGSGTVKTARELAKSPDHPRQFVELLFYGQSPATRAKSTTAKAKIANSPVIAKTSSKCQNSASFRSKHMIS
jgi:hypothetical protein